MLMMFAGPWQLTAVFLMNCQHSGVAHLPRDLMHLQLGNMLRYKHCGLWLTEFDRLWRVLTRGKCQAVGTEVGPEL
jgi:hypothetical protein